MIRKIIRIVASLIGLVLGILILFAIKGAGLVDLPKGVMGGAIYLAVGLIFGLISYLIFPKIVKLTAKMAKTIEAELEGIPGQDLLFGAIGLIIGLIIAFFISQPLSQIPIFGPILSIMVYIILSYLGIRVAVRKKPDVLEGALKFPSFNKEKEEAEIHLDKLEGFKKRKNIPDYYYKVLDTSVIIDGRIADIIKTGFLEGIVIIPSFVLLELQHIADSKDELRRERGRRGLDVLKEIQDQDEVTVEISQNLYEDIDEVDSKLLALTKDIKAKLVTNDYNLNKVADVSGIKVLNINELANAVKAPVIHGQTIRVNIVKEGSEEGQGIAYLEDGTMIVVNGGKDYVGSSVDVDVTSVIQTAAGKMIFTKLSQ